MPANMAAAPKKARAMDAGAQMERLVSAHPRLPMEFRARAYSQAGSVFHGAGQIHRAEAAYLLRSHLDWDKSCSV